MSETSTHPYLHDPILYITNLPAHVTDTDLARALEFCVPFRPTIIRDGSGMPLSGTIEFKDFSKGIYLSEKALTTLNGRSIPFVNPSAQLELSPFPPTNPPQVPPPPQAQPRLVRHLPPQFNDSSVYDIFRTYGPMLSVRVQADGSATIQYYLEEDARNAEAALHCAEIGDSTIAIQVIQQRPGVNPNATTFVPISQVRTRHSPPRPSFQYPTIRQPAPFVHGPGQQVQFAPPYGPGSTSHSGLIDPCNLFCKNLDPEIDSNELFSQFRKFGQIVSARVMRNENGQSRGFGFVSYQTPDQAAAALSAMNGIILGSKQLVVRLHEPKQLRQEKLAHRFGSFGRGSPRFGSGATSPTLSEEGGSAWGGSPGHRIVSGGTQERVRRSSGSYYTAALSGNLNLPMRYEELSALSPVVRREVLSGELSRRIKELDLVQDAELDAVVDSLLGISLQNVVDGIQDRSKLEGLVKDIKEGKIPESEQRQSEEPEPKRDTEPSPATSSSSHLLPPPHTASAPEHPSTPLSLSPTPPRTSSPSGSALLPRSEKDRLLVAVGKLEADPTIAKEIAELLMSLSKRERALCLFNAEVLRVKVAEAREVISVVLGGDDEEDATAVETRTSLSVPITPTSKKVLDTSLSPQTPDLSSRGPSAPSSPPTPAASSSSQPHTLATLARLPATEILKLIHGPHVTGLPVVKADPIIVQQTDKFVDSLMNLSEQVRKQRLGAEVFKVIKSAGVKYAPKLTIQLLDKEDLRSLAHLMNSYPAVLREKALLLPVPGK
ncbi:hypothetical protein BU17DRAFT_48641 [Hysterangium stoloniferum]|nr:hypothetical protein BU17DRAFT_48641 [Hysterangium stoloniferum]